MVPIAMIAKNTMNAVKKILVGLVRGRASLIGRLLLPARGLGIVNAVLMLPKLSPDLSGLLFRCFRQHPVDDSNCPFPGISMSPELPHVRSSHIFAGVAKRNHPSEHGSD